jgi:anti-anti-sigma factor
MQRDVAGRAVLVVEGAADLAATPTLHDALQRFVGQDGSTGPMVIDLDAATVVDDAALGLLLGAAATARAHGRSLSVVCSDERLRGRLADTRFDRAVDVVDSLTAVVAEPRTGLS